MEIVCYNVDWIHLFQDIGHWCAICTCGDEQLVSCGMWCCAVCQLIPSVTVDAGNRLPQNVGNELPVYSTPSQKTVRYKQSPLYEPQISHTDEPLFTVTAVIF
jgi:hypothetical protein